MIFSFHTEIEGKGRWITGGGGGGLGTLAPLSNYCPPPPPGQRVCWPLSNYWGACPPLPTPMQVPVLYLMLTKTNVTCSAYCRVSSRRAALPSTLSCLIKAVTNIWRRFSRSAGPLPRPKVPLNFRGFARRGKRNIFKNILHRKYKHGSALY